MLPRPHRGDHLREFPHSHAELIKAVAADYEIPLDRLFSKARDARTAAARQIIVALLYWHTGLSLQLIGEMFKRTHGTIIFARDRMLKRIEKEPELMNYIRHLEAEHFGKDPMEETDRERLDKRARNHILPTRWQQK